MALGESNLEEIEQTVLRRREAADLSGEVCGGNLLTKMKISHGCGYGCRCGCGCGCRGV